MGLQQGIFTLFYLHDTTSVAQLSGNLASQNLTFSLFHAIIVGT